MVCSTDACRLIEERYAIFNKNNNFSFQVFVGGNVFKLPPRLFAAITLCVAVVR
jgi:hypothetical protein